MANMKKQFPEFYQSKLDIRDLESSSNNLIVLDTNFLLDIIQMPTDISKKYVEALKKVKDNLYIPYLVALEFNFKKSVIKKTKHYNIGKYKNNVKNSINSLEEHILTYSLINIKEKQEQFSEQLLEVVKEFKGKILPMLDEEVAKAITEEEKTVYEELINIIEDKIGEKYDQKFIDSIEKEGVIRYEKKLPPGFDDKPKEEEEEPTITYGNIVYQRKFADLIIWKDIINHSKNKSIKGCKVIYITNDGQADRKKDLLYKVKKLTVGPHIFLMNELQTEAQKELYIISNLRFVQLASDLSDDQIKEFKDLFELEYKEKKPQLFEDEKDLLTKDYLNYFEKRNNLINDTDLYKQINLRPEIRNNIAHKIESDDKNIKNNLVNKMIIDLTNELKSKKNLEFLEPEQSNNLDFYDDILRKNIEKTYLDEIVKNYLKDDKSD